MIKSKVNAAIAALALFLGAAGASAITIQSGDFKMTFDNYDSATTNYGVGAGVKCTTVLGCDGDAGSPAHGSIGSFNPSADAMGICSVASITKISTATPRFTRGGTFDLFLISADHNITFGPGVTATKDLNAGMYPSISNGTAVLALSGVFASGWTLLSSGDLTGSVPEPGSLALLALGAISRWDMA